MNRYDPTSIEELNKYRVIRELGTGFTSTVYLVVDESTDPPTEWAMKKMSIIESTAKGLDISQLFREIQININLSNYLSGCNPNIICYREYFVDNDTIYIISQYIDGMDLIELVRNIPRGGNFKLNFLHGIMSQCLSALKTIHEAGYAHRDIKAENIMMDKRGQIYIIDFGFACDICTGSPGTLDYAPPELISGISERVAIDNPRAGLELYQKHDIWSMGITFYILANKGFPFDTSSPTRVRHMIETCNLSPSRYSESKINILIHRMLTCSYKYRPTAVELLSSLDKIDTIQ